MPKPRGAGDLRDRVQFQRRVERLDEYGNALAEWADLFGSRWCALTPMRGDETVQAGRVQGRAMWDCWVRFDSETSTLQPGDRAVNSRTGQTYDVRFVADMDGQRTWLLVQMMSGGPDG